MIGLDSKKLSPDDWLKKIKSDSNHLGKLKVFFGYAAGVGKTYAMLEEAHEQVLLGRKVLVGYIEPHTRPDTISLLKGLDVLPTKSFNYKGINLFDFDLDEALNRHPDLVLVDELAHTNPLSSRNKKRYQDIEELLKAGIDVYTTVNVQHIESLNDIVEEITGIEVKETVPDVFFNDSSLKVIDIEANELLERLKLGKIYQKEATSRALKNFFIPENLKLLRGLAIQKAADHIMLSEGRDSQKVIGIESRFLSLILDEDIALTKRTLRWTARISQLLRARWYVLNIQNKNGEKNNSDLISLAGKLGAEVITIESYDLIETISSFVKLQGITDLVIGKNVTLPWWKKLFRVPLEDKLFEDLKETEIHILPYSKKSVDTKKRVELTWSRFFEGKVFKDLCITLLLVGLTTILSFSLFGSGFGDQNIIILYLLTVILIARLTTGYVWSLVASALTVIFFNWFFVYPLHSLTVLKEGYPFTLIFMLVVALLVSNIVVRMKASVVSANRKEHQIQFLYELNRRYLFTNQLMEVLQITATYLSNSLACDVYIYDETLENIAKSLKNKKRKNSYLDKIEEIGIAHWSAVNQKEAGKETDTLSGAKGRYFPVILKGKTVAIISILDNDQTLELSEENLSFVRLVSVQMAIAIEQKLLQREKEMILVDKEREKTKGNLLRAVSHDLRTPLTAISGSVEMILNDVDESKLPQDEKRNLLSGIKKDTEWLLRMIENLLSITRINTQKMAVTTSQEVLDDILSAAIQRTKKYYHNIPLEIILPEENFFVEVDPILIEQVFFNLLENSIRYSNEQSTIQLIVEKNGRYVDIHFINQGKEQDVAYLNKIFDNDENETTIDSKKGLGIGLSIVKTIISAHNGKIFALSTDKGLIDVTVELIRTKGTI